MDLTRALVCALLWASCGLGAQPFELQLTGLSDVWFPNGAVVKVPPDKCSELQVRLNKPWSAGTRIDLVELKLDGAYPKFASMASPDGYLYSVKTREPLGLLTSQSHHLEAATSGKIPLKAEWTVTRWEKAYIEAVAISSGGSPIDIQMSSPLGGLVLLDRDGTVRLSGRLLGDNDARLTINDRIVSRIVSKPGYEYDEKVKVKGSDKEVILKGEDGAGDVTILVLHIQPNSR